jgi:hypothetical protein
MSKPPNKRLGAKAWAQIALLAAGLIAICAGAVDHISGTERRVSDWLVIGLVLNALGSIWLFSGVWRKRQQKQEGVSG